MAWDGLTAFQRAMAREREVMAMVAGIAMTGNSNRDKVFAALVAKEVQSHDLGNLLEAIRVGDSKAAWKAIGVWSIEQQGEQRVMEAVIEAAGRLNDERIGGEALARATFKQRHGDKTVVDEINAALARLTRTGGQT